MELIYYNNEFSEKIEKCVIALGMFDGIHIAHKIIINELLNTSKIKKIKSAIITFDPHPDYVLGKSTDLGYILPLEERKKYFSSLGIDYLIIIKFDINFANLSYEQFEEIFLNKLDIDSIIIGYDYRYGKDGLGNKNTLMKKYNTIVINEICASNKKIGSKLIRDYLKKGYIVKANEILGRNYSIEGIVVHGNQVGRKLGFRTANIQIDNEYCEMKKGVYAGIITLNNKRYKSVCNIGNNPTLNYTKKVRLEVHIIDFDDDIYDMNVVVEFVDFIRAEIKFNNKDELINQINKDVCYTKERINL